MLQNSRYTLIFTKSTDYVIINIIFDKKYPLVVMYLRNAIIYLLYSKFIQSGFSTSLRLLSTNCTRDIHKVGSVLAGICKTANYIFNHI